MIKIIKYYMFREIYSRLGIEAPGRVLVVTNEMLDCKNEEERLKCALSFEGPDRDYAMILLGILRNPNHLLWKGD